MFSSKVSKLFWRLSSFSFEIECAANKAADSHDQHSRLWVTVPEASKLFVSRCISYATNDACLFSQYSSAILSEGECLRVHACGTRMYVVPAVLCSGDSQFSLKSVSPLKR